MDDEAAAAITPHLKPREKIVWAGRPLPAMYAFYNGAGMGCFGMFCLGGFALQAGSWTIFLVSLILLVFPIFAGKKGTTVRYALTDKRAITIATWPWAWERSVPVDRFNICMRQENSGSAHDGRASIMYRKIDGQPWEIWRGTPFHAEAFLGIKDADEVEALIKARVGSSVTV